MAAFRTELEALSPSPASSTRPASARARRAGTAADAPTLEGARAALVAAAMAMQNADVAPSADQLAACERARVQLRAVTARWHALETTGLATLNARRSAAGQAPIALPAGQAAARR